jgi:hypothetical protein
MASKDQTGGRYLEDCSVPSEVDDASNPFVEDVKSYVLDAERVKQLGQKVRN